MIMGRTKKVSESLTCRSRGGGTEISCLGGQGQEHHEEQLCHTSLAHHNGLDLVELHVAHQGLGTVVVAVHSILGRHLCQRIL
jgi:hypothetical protein